MLCIPLSNELALILANPAIEKLWSTRIDHFLLLRLSHRAVDSAPVGTSKAGFVMTGGSSTMGTVGSAPAAEASSAESQATVRGGAPDWARRMKRHQAVSHGVSAAAHAVRSGDSHGSGSSVSLSESDRS